MSCLWDGLDDDGDPVEPGRYRLRVTLPEEDREMVFPRRLDVRVGDIGAGGYVLAFDPCETRCSVERLSPRDGRRPRGVRRDGCFARSDSPGPSLPRHGHRPCPRRWRCSPARCGARSASRHHLDSGGAHLGAHPGRDGARRDSATFQRVPAAFAIAVFAVLPLRLPSRSAANQLPPHPALRRDRRRLSARSMALLRRPRG